MMLEPAKVSVIIPCYNCSLTIHRAVNSVLAQTQLPAEILLIDDKSTDGSIQIVNQLAALHPELIKVVALPNNQGAANARNAGWEIAKQPYIAFLDSDDAWHQKKIEIQYNFMMKNLDVMLSGHGCAIGLKGMVVGFQFIERKNIIINKFSMLFKSPFSTPTVMLKTTCPFRFQTNKRYAEDILLWLSIGFLDYKIVKLEIVLACVFKNLYGAGGLSSNLLSMEQEELKNYFQLFHEKKINLIVYISAFVFSITKFVKRLLVISLRAIFQKTGLKSC